MSSKKAITRRQFIKNTSVAAIGGSLFLGATGTGTGTVFGKEEKTSAKAYRL